MKQFQTQLQAKAHLKRITNAKTTFTKTRHSETKSSEQNEVELMLHLYDIGETQSVPIYRLLKPMNLQQYTRELILRGYGVNIGRLARLEEKERGKLFEEIKVLPGHSVKLNKIIGGLMELTQGNESGYSENSVFSGKSSKRGKDLEYENQLEKAINIYAGKDNVSTTEIKKKSLVLSSEKKNFKKQKSRQSIKFPNIDKTDGFRTSKNNDQKGQNFKKSFSRQKKSLDLSKTTTKQLSIKNPQSSQSSIKKPLPPTTKSIVKKQRSPIQVNLQIDKIKNDFKSIDGGIMTSTIVNVDLQQICFCISSFLQKMIKLPQKKVCEKQLSQQQDYSEQIDIEDMNNILRDSYLHPLYRRTEQIGNQDDEVTEEIDESEYKEPQCKIEQSSFFGHSSVNFGLNNSLQIFDEPEPTEVDYYTPTIDSITNFIKNIVISAKMQRQVPVLSLLYVKKFLSKSLLSLTTLNYKRILVSCLLLASKVWDDQSFQTPSFSHTFPDYSTVLLNQLQKQILKSINYQLKLNKKQYALLYYEIRQYKKSNIKSFQNRLISIKRVMELQKGIKKQYRSDNFKKRKSF